MSDTFVEMSNSRSLPMSSTTMQSREPKADDPVRQTILSPSVMWPSDSAMTTASLICPMRVSGKGGRRRVAETSALGSVRLFEWVIRMMLVASSMPLGMG